MRMQSDEMILQDIQGLQSLFLDQLNFIFKRKDRLSIYFIKIRLIASSAV